MAGPHSAASLALIMKRFPYMTNEQALYTMFTTGRQNNTINAPGTSIPAIPNPTAGQIVQVPDNRNGWNTVSLRDAFKGPAQLLGPVNIDTHGYTDVWSNDISDVAIHARQLEDAAEEAAWQATLVARGWTNGLPADATDADKSDYAIGLRRQAARNARVYIGSLTKDGDGALYLAGNDTWQGGSIVAGGKLSVLGKHASHIDVNGGTLTGSGSIGDGINVVTGLLWPGFSAAEAAKITEVAVVPGNVLNASAPVHIGHKGGFASTIRSNTDYTSVVTTSNLILEGTLYLDIVGAPTSGAVLTIMRGKKVVGTFDGLPEGGTLVAGGKTFRISYLNNRVTLTAV